MLLLFFLLSSDWLRVRVSFPFWAATGVKSQNRQKTKSGVSKSLSDAKLQPIWSSLSSIKSISLKTHVSSRACWTTKNPLAGHVSPTIQVLLKSENCADCGFVTFQRLCDHCEIEPFICKRPPRLTGWAFAGRLIPDLWIRFGSDDRTRTYRAKELDWRALLGFFCVVKTRSSRPTQSWSRPTRCCTRRKDEVEGFHCREGGGVASPTRITSKWKNIEVHPEWNIEFEKRIFTPRREMQQQHWIKLVAVVTNLSVSELNYWISNAHILIITVI